MRAEEELIYLSGEAKREGERESMAIKGLSVSLKSWSNSEWSPESVRIQKVRLFPREQKGEELELVRAHYNEGGNEVAIEKGREKEREKDGVGGREG